MFICRKRFSFDAVAVVVRLCSLMNERNYLLKALLVYRMNSWFRSYVTFSEKQTNIYRPPSSTSSRDKYLQDETLRQAITNEIVGQKGLTENPFAIWSKLNRLGFKFYLMNFKCFCGTKKNSFWWIMAEGEPPLVDRLANLLTHVVFCSTKRPKWQLKL